MSLYDEYPDGIDDPTMDGTEYTDADVAFPVHDELPLVAATSEMNDATFVKHWNARHVTPGSIPLNERTSWPDEIATFRAFHKRTHGNEMLVRYGQNHRHNPGNQPWQDGEK